MSTLAKIFAVIMLVFAAVLASGLYVYMRNAPKYMELWTTEKQERAKQVADLVEGVEIEPKAILRPPVIIGAHTKISARAEIINTVIGPGCSIADGAVLQGSVLWEEVEVENKARIVDSVIGAGQKIAESMQLCNTAIENFGAVAPNNAKI